MLPQGEIPKDQVQVVQLYAYAFQLYAHAVVSSEKMLSFKMVMV